MICATGIHLCCLGIKAVQEMTALQRSLREHWTPCYSPVTILEAVGAVGAAAGVRLPSPAWVPGGCGGGGTLGRLRGLGTGRGLGRVPCSCVVSLCVGFCLAKGGVLGGVGVCGGVGPGSGPCSPSRGCVGGCGGGWLGAWMGGRLLEQRRMPEACCRGGEGLRVLGFGDVPVPGEL